MMTVADSSSNAEHRASITNIMKHPSFLTIGTVTSLLFSAVGLALLPTVGYAQAETRRTGKGFKGGPSEAVLEENLNRHRRWDAQCEEAHTLLNAGKATEAIALCNAVLQEAAAWKDYPFPPAQMGLADSYAAKGDTEQAIETYRLVLYPENHPNWGSNYEEDPAILMQFALLLHRTRHYEEAFMVYQRAIAHETDSLAPKISEGVVLNRQNMTTTQLPFGAHLMIAKKNAVSNPILAVAQAREAVRLRPEHPLGHYYLGVALHNQVYNPPTLPEQRQKIYDESQEELGKAAISGNPTILAEIKRIYPTALKTTAPPAP